MSVHPFPLRDPAALLMPAEPPEHLSAGGKAFWRETVSHAHWLRLSDSLAFAVLAEMVALYRADPAGADAELVGGMIDGLHRFGLTPAGRAELGIH